VPRLHVVDGSSYIFRAYWAIRSLTNSAGEPTNAVYGFAQMMEKMLREEQPEYLAIVFDAEGPTFRNEIHPDYKAHRPPPPEDLVVQIPAIHELADAFRMRRFVVPGVEADDVIATLARRAKAEGFEVRLISGDKDLMQLVDDRLSLFEPMRGEHHDAQGVQKKLGAPPAQVRDLLALAGDSTDNVPGVPGVGVKTAAKFLAEHGDLEGVLAAAREGIIKGKTGQRLVQAEADARLSQRLTTLNDEVELDISGLDDLRWAGPDHAKLEAIYRRGEFTRLLTRYDAPAEDAARGAATPAIAPIDLEPAETVALSSTPELAEWLSTVEAPGPLAVRLESPSARALDAQIDGVALAAPGRETIYVSCAAVPWTDLLAELGPYLSNPEIEIACDESKLLCGVAAEAGHVVAGLAFDLKLASYLLQPDEVDHGYGVVARRYFDHEPIDRDATLRSGRKRVPFASVDADVARKLAGEGAGVVLAAARHLPQALREAGVETVLLDLELPLVPVLARVERTGVKVDTDRLRELSAVFDGELSKLEERCHEIAGREFNIGSPKQLEKILFEELGLKIKKRTSTGRPSTDHSVLEELSADHELPQAVVDYRQVQKLKSTYVDALPKLVSPRSGRVHTIFNQAMAATGRLSSMEPNLQNIPIRTEIGRQLRTAFVAEPGHVLVSVDYSQIELRVLAHLSGDAVLTQAFLDGADVHVRTAAALFEVQPERVTRAQRSQAKAVNYGVAYGMGPVRLARDMKVARKLASQFISDYFERQPGVHDYVERTLELAREKGEVRTLLGRRRLVPDVESSSRGVRSQAERAARATPVQGSAADLIKLAMLRVDAVLADRFPEARLILQVHDELLVEAPEDRAEEVAIVVKHQMESVYPLSVPLEADAHVGRSWDEAH
jgi:DNA polymerase-1